MGASGKRNPKNLTNKGAGRQKGSKNKYGKAVRDQFLEAFEDLGGKTELVKWAKKSPANKLEFYKLLIHILPKTVEASVEHEWNIEGLDFRGDSKPEKIVAKCIAHTKRRQRNRKE